MLEYIQFALAYSAKPNETFILSNFADLLGLGSHVPPFWLSALCWLGLQNCRINFIEVTYKFWIYNSSTFRQQFRNNLALVIVAFCLDSLSHLSFTLMCLLSSNWRIFVKTAVYAEAFTVCSINCFHPFYWHLSPKTTDTIYIYIPTFKANKRIFILFNNVVASNHERFINFPSKIVSPYIN